MNELEQRIQLVPRAYDAFNRRDIDTVLSMLDPEVEWSNMLDRTAAHGREAVREYWTRQFQQIDSRVEPVEFVSDGDRLIVEVHQVVHDRPGRVMRDSHVAHRYTFHAERVLRMQVHRTIDDARR